MPTSRALLLEQLEAAVRSNGQAGKTTAADLRGILRTIIEELVERTDAGGTLPVEMLAALGGSDGIPSGANRFITEEGLALLRQELDLFRLNRANLVRADGTREYFTGHEAALLAAQSGDTVLIPAPIAEPGKIGDQEQINIQPGVSAQTAGFPIGTPTTTGDVITLRGGSGKLLGGGSTLYVNSSQAWGLGSYNTPASASIDYDVEQLHIIAQIGTSAITMQGATNIRFSGNIVSKGRCLHVRFGGRFLGTGSMMAVETGSGIFCNANSSIIWRGFIGLQGNSLILILNSSTVSLERCLVEGNVLRTAGADLLVDGTGAGDNTLILTDTTVLGKPGVPVIAAKKVVLRGTTVVVGTITTDQLLDERPVGGAVRTQRLTPEPALAFAPVVWTNLFKTAAAADGTIRRIEGGYNREDAGGVGSLMSGPTTAAIKASLRLTLNKADLETKCGLNNERNTSPDEVAIKLGFHMSELGVRAYGAAYGFPFSDYMPIVDGTIAQLDVMQDGSAMFLINGTVIATKPAGTLNGDGLYADCSLYTTASQVSKVETFFANPVPTGL